MARVLLTFPSVAMLTFHQIITTHVSDKYKCDIDSQALPL